MCTHGCHGCLSRIRILVFDRRLRVSRQSIAAGIVSTILIVCRYNNYKLFGITICALGDKRNAGLAIAELFRASYRALIAAAELCGDVETKRVCEQILPEEEAMADWLAERLPGTVQKFLARDETPDTTAKH